MTKQFKIYHEGTTDDKVTIVSLQGQPFNKKAKIQMYLSFGYKVYDMNDKEIKN